MQCFAVKLERITETFTLPRCFVWRKCLDRSPDTPDFEDYGWKYNTRSLLCIWINGLPAPNALLCLLSYDWKRWHIESKCACIVNFIKCTDACNPKTCDNRPFEGVVDDEDDILMRNKNWWKWGRWWLGYRLWLAYYF